MNKKLKWAVIFVVASIAVFLYNNYRTQQIKDAVENMQYVQEEVEIQEAE